MRLRFDVLFSTLCALQIIVLYCIVWVLNLYQLAATRGGPYPRGIDPDVVVTGDPNDTNPWVHTCLTAFNNVLYDGNVLYDYKVHKKAVILQGNRAIPR